MAPAPQFARIDGGGTTLVFAFVQGTAADLVYLGALLPRGEDLAALAASTTRSVHESQPDTPPTPGLLPERKGGWSGAPAIEVTHEGAAIETDFRVTDWSLHGDCLSIAFADETLGLTVSVMWEVDESGLVDCSLRVSNTSQTTYILGRLAALAMPVPSRFTEVTTYSGRWAGEMRENRRAIAPDGFVKQSAIGKQGFGGGNWLLLHDPSSEEVIGAHLEWSGDYDTRLECDTQGAGDGRAILQMSVRLDAGEIALEPGKAFESENAILARAENRDALAQAFHRYLRSTIIPFHRDSGPRKVHLNSWEALGFNLSGPELFTLVDNAAELGVERFVLDDGWFGGRRGDRTSLGDWFVSKDVFPNGLGPLIERVHAKGMDFGLWVEPEMVSPESDLYRAHPDWCLHLEGRERGTMRGQLVLDLTHPDAFDYVYERLVALLTENDIAYIKWDHNRDIFPTAARGYAQTHALYQMLEGLRARPGLEIESCSSGGGRIDTRLLSRTHRVWPSDNNDAIERVRITRAWSQFVPLEVLGSHVGPSPNPITGRRLKMDFRAKVAMFGHMGVEADPTHMSERDRATLAAHIALYKEWRGVLHAGDLMRIEHPDPGISGLMASHEGKALALAAQTCFSPAFDAAPVRLPGLDPQALYRVTLPQPWPFKAALYLANADQWREGITLSGRALGTQGIALPLTHPETAWLIALEKL